MFSVVKLFKQFPTEESCVIFLEKIRFKDGVICPKCGSSKTCKNHKSTVETRSGNKHQCQDCSHSFTVTVGTIFHHTHLDLRNWFYIISTMLTDFQRLILLKNQVLQSDLQFYHQFPLLCPPLCCYRL